MHGGANALLASEMETAQRRQATRLAGERRSLKAVTIALIALACMTSVVAMAWSALHTRTLALSNAAIAAANTAHTLANQADASFKMADTVLVSLVDKVEVEGWSSANTARLRALMIRQMADLPALQGLFIYDENGRWIVNSASTRFDGRNNGDRAYFQYHKHHPGRGVHIGAPIIGRTSGMWVIPVSRRIDRPDGSFAGVALATIKIDHFRRIYEGLDIGSDGRILMALAYVDGLTELSNRRYYEQAWDREHRRAFRDGTSLAVLLIDVDYFKRYNDRYGHALGDACLKAVAQAILRGLRRSDDLAARYGSEEFIVVLPDTDAAGARGVADAIHGHLAALALAHADSRHGRVTASIGVHAAVPVQTTDDGRAFVVHADAALYRAKAKGRNRTAG